MEYELSEADTTINLRGIFLILLFIGAILYFILPVLLAVPPDMYIDASGNRVKIPEGFIKNANGTPVPLKLPTPIVIEKIITITPTPDNGVYYVSESESGSRKLGRYFVFYRDDVLGKKDLDFHVTVYGYKFLNSYHWYNWHDGKWYETEPNSPDDIFLFIYVQLYSDDISGDDVRNYVPDESHYQINYNNTMYYPILFQKDLTLYELQYTYNLNDDSIIEYYGQFVFQALTGKDAGKPVSIPIKYSLGGKSNAVDGYIVYALPKQARNELDKLRVYGDFYAYGHSEWVFKF